MPWSARVANQMGRIIEIVEYDPVWGELYSREAVAIGNVLIGLRSQSFHIGSTAIPEMPAKAVIDILLAVDSLNELDAYGSQLGSLGYAALGEFGILCRRFYTKGGDNRTHHIHAFEFGSPEIDRHLRFRDFLRDSREDAKAYAVLKRRLAQPFRNDPRGYSEAKIEVIGSIDAKAREWYLQNQG
jgi:GrpB-like predicted nucleotidyltransferase (UPF0157 family)